MKDLSIYVHIPFCKQKCKYCDFCSFCANDKEQEMYFLHLKREIITKSKEFKNCIVNSIYFGGGTPSSVDEKYILEILNTILTEFNIKANCEKTIECNPCSSTERKLKSYKDAGFNRISFGVQSFDDKVLKSIGRLHSGQEAEKAICLAKKMGFENISCDLILGLPFQTKKMILDDIKRLSKLGVKHISTYMLQLEKGTLLFDEVVKGKTKVADEDLQAKLYEIAVKELKCCGFEQYEVSNFAKEKRYSEHNLSYWRRKEYIGFGLSAHSFIAEKRFANSKNMKEYLEGKDVFCESLSKDEIVTEIIMLGLRYFEGFSLDELKKYGKDIEKDRNFQELVKKEYLFIDGDKVKINPNYYVINNEIILKLI